MSATGAGPASAGPAVPGPASARSGVAGPVGSGSGASGQDAVAGIADPLDVAAIRAAVLRPGSPWRGVEVSPQVGSTNAVAADAARAGAAEGLVVTTEWQNAGRGRRGRTWQVPPGAAVTLSVLLRPGDRGVAPGEWSWLPLLAGLAVADAVEAVTAEAALAGASGDSGVAGATRALSARVRCGLKWPNDVLAARVDHTVGEAVGVDAGVAVSAPSAGSSAGASLTGTSSVESSLTGTTSAAASPAGGWGKLAGVLAESVLPPRGARLDSGAVVLGIGLNVHQIAAELPPPPPGGLPPVSLALLDARVARTRVLVALLDALGARYLAWCAAGADDRTLADDYTRRCVTVGSSVRVHLPGGAVRAGRADGIDRAGHLLVDGVAVTAGDVEHVRPG